MAHIWTIAAQHSHINFLDCTVRTQSIVDLKTSTVHAKRLLSFLTPDLGLGVQDKEFYFQHAIQQSMNVAIGAICWLGLTAIAISYFKRIYLAQKSKKRWCVQCCGGAVAAGLTLSHITSSACREAGVMPSQLACRCAGSVVISSNMAITQCVVLAVFSMYS